MVLIGALPAVVSSVDDDATTALAGRQLGAVWVLTGATESTLDKVLVESAHELGVLGHDTVERAVAQHDAAVLGRGWFITGGGERV